jgi:hypothetical protein
VKGEGLAKSRERMERRNEEAFFRYCRHLSIDPLGKVLKRKDWQTGITD